MITKEALRQFADNSAALRDEVEWLRFAKEDGDTSEILVATISAVEDDIKKRQAFLDYEKSEIENLFAKCGNPIVRSALSLHFISGYQWKEIGLTVRKTEDEIKHAAYRFINGCLSDGADKRKRGSE